MMDTVCPHKYTIPTCSGRRADVADVVRLDNDPDCLACNTYIHKHTHTHQQARTAPHAVKQLCNLHMLALRPPKTRKTTRYATLRYATTVVATIHMFPNSQTRARRAQVAPAK